MKGSIILYKDLSAFDIPNTTKGTVFNAPFNLYSDGSYFADDDCIIEVKAHREYSAIAQSESLLLKLRKYHITELFAEFPDIKLEMLNIAAARKNYH